MTKQEEQLKILREIHGQCHGVEAEQHHGMYVCRNCGAATESPYIVQGCSACGRNLGWEPALEFQRIARLKTRLEEYKLALRTRKLKGNEHYYACTWDDVEFLLNVINKDRYA